MKRFLLTITLSFFIPGLYSSEPFFLEDQAQEWINAYATDEQEKKFNLSAEHTEILANALFYTYRLVKLDELAHACNRIVVYVHKVLPEVLHQEHQVAISPATLAAFSAFINSGKEDLQTAYVQATQQFQAALTQLEQAGIAQLADAYNAVKKNVYTNVETWTKEEGVQLSQAAFENLNEEQSKNLFTFGLKFDTPHEQAVQLLETVPLKNLENFFAFQTEAHSFIKSIWQTHLISLLTQAQAAGLKEVKLHVFTINTTKDSEELTE